MASLAFKRTIYAALRTGPLHKGPHLMATRWLLPRSPCRSITRSTVRTLSVRVSRGIFGGPSIRNSMSRRVGFDLTDVFKQPHRRIEAAKRVRTQAGDDPSLGVSSAPSALQLLAVDEDATALLASAIAQHVQEGDCFCLYGNIGAGKSTFSRALIRSVANDEELTVASPTFMLKLIYDGHAGPPVHHFDLYRLRGPEDFANLDLDDSFTNAVSLFEWAQRLEESMPADHCELRVHAVRPGDPLEAQLAAQLAWVRQQQLLAGGKGDVEEEDGEEDDVGEEMYIDNRVRVFEFIPHGARCEALIGQLEADLAREGVKELCAANGLQLLGRAALHS